MPEETPSRTPQDEGIDGRIFDAVIAISGLKAGPIWDDGFLIECPEDIKPLMDGPYLADNCFTNLPEQFGCFAVRVKVHFHQGYFEGYRADGESEWEFEIISAIPLRQELAQSRSTNLPGETPSCPLCGSVETNVFLGICAAYHGKNEPAHIFHWATTSPELRAKMRYLPEKWANSHGLNVSTHHVDNLVFANWLGWHAGAEELAEAREELAGVREELERTKAELDKCGKENCMGRKIEGLCTWVSEERLIASQKLSGELETVESNLADYAKRFFRLFDQYRNAWLREMGGVIVPKHWEIDGFVLRAEEIYEKAKLVDRMKQIMIAEEKRGGTRTEMFDAVFKMLAEDGGDKVATN